MKSYPQRVSDNILPLSVESTLPKAFEEWSFTERTEDHGKPVETCQLCEQEDLRYQFEIRNALTKKTLWVGSQCILKFGLSVFEGGQLLSPAAAKKKLDRLVQKMRLDSCLAALEKLSEVEENAILKSALEYYRKNKFLSPKLAFVVLWRLQTHGIDHSPSFFKVSLRRAKYKADLRAMTPRHAHVIWRSLTATQRRTAEAMGHRPPGEQR